MYSSSAYTTGYILGGREDAKVKKKYTAVAAGAYCLDPQGQTSPSGQSKTMLTSQMTSPGTRKEK